MFSAQQDVGMFRGGSEAENYTVSIAAKRSFPLYGLEGPHRIFSWFKKDLGGGRLGSIEVDGLKKVFFFVVLMDLEAQTLSELRSFYDLAIYMGLGSRFY